MKRIIIFTDGACSKNPGPGGWAAVLNHDEEYEVLTGYELETTNNRMELTAVVEAIKVTIDQGYDYITINSDSAYVINPIKLHWLSAWKSNGWCTQSYEKVKNSDLWKKVDKLLQHKDVTIMFNKVKGHSGNTFNELADTYAKKAVEIAKAKALRS
jgi:ribonuclease HI